MLNGFHACQVFMCLCIVLFKNDFLCHLDFENHIPSQTKHFDCDWANIFGAPPANFYGRSSIIHYLLIFLKKNHQIFGGAYVVLNRNF